MNLKSVLCLVFSLFSSLTIYAQTDSCKVILVIAKGQSEPEGISETYQPNGIYLLQNGIYNFTIIRTHFKYYRILKIWNDSIQIAWTLDTLPAFSFRIQESKKV
jgi:hypothetical protein